MRTKQKEVSRLPEEKRVELDALYRQATEGDCQMKVAPKTPKLKSEYDAWMSKKGMSYEDAMREYTKMVHELFL